MSLFYGLTVNVFGLLVYIPYYIIKNIEKAAS